MMRFGATRGRVQIKSVRRVAALVAALAQAPHLDLMAANTDRDVPSRSITELAPLATIHVGKTADWVAIVSDAVWVGSTGPFAVHKINPDNGRLVATVKLPGEPCAGLTSGFGSLWVPLCGHPAVAQVDLHSNRLKFVIKLPGVTAEGGVATSADSVWIVLDGRGSLARISPKTGRITQIVAVPPGSFNPLYRNGKIWITQAIGAQITLVDALQGTTVATVATGPNPRFLTASSEAVWTLNQGDGSVTRIDSETLDTHTIDLGIPGHGGDITFGAGMVWASVAKVPLSAIDATTVTLRCRWTGPGGDSLGIGHGAIWLTDYHAGTVSKIGLQETLIHCNGAPHAN